LEGDVRFLILGNGWVCRSCYQPAIRRLGAGAALVFDTTPENDGAAAVDRALKLARRSGDLFVIVATPNASHWSLAKAFLATGNRVLVEKPLALPGEIGPHKVDTEGLRRLMVSTPYRHRPDVSRLRGLLAAGAIGEVRAIAMSWRRRAGIPRPGSWYTNRQLSGGGVLVDLGPHLLDLGLDLLGWPEVLIEQCTLSHADDWTGRSSAWMAGTANDDLPCDVELGACLALSDAGGRRITVDVAWASEVAEDTTTIEAIGANGRLRLTTLFGFAPGRSVGSVTGAATIDIALDRRPEVDFARMLQAFDDGTGAAGQDGIAVMDVIARAYRVAASASAAS
jgi:oxidoreductase